MGKIIALIVLAIVLLLGVTSCGLWMQASNGEIDLRTRYEAKQKQVETSHDTMWKTISQQYQINDAYKDTFIAGLKELSAGRQGGSIFRSQTEANVQLGLPTETFKIVMASVEGKRAELKREQDTLADMYREHKKFCSQLPNSIFIGGRVMPEPVMISSTRTKEAVRTGVDDDVKLK